MRRRSDGLTRTFVLEDSEGSHPMQMVPVVYRDELLGAVTIETPAEQDARTERLLEIFAGAFGVALHNAIMHATSEVMARQDPLTGCRQPAQRPGGL